jgi:hypothetical protein
LERHKPAAAEQAVAVDRLAAREIGAFSRFGIHQNPKLVGVGEGRKAATEPQGVGPRPIKARIMIQSGIMSHHMLAVPGDTG